MHYPCGENKDAYQLAVTAKLICVFVFAYAKRRFSNDVAQMSPVMSNLLFAFAKTKAQVRCAVIVHLITVNAFLFKLYFSCIKYNIYNVHNGDNTNNLYNKESERSPNDFCHPFLLHIDSTT